MADNKVGNHLMQQISRLLDESRASNAIHNRKLKELSKLRSSSSHPQFFTAFSKSITPLFDFQRRTSSAERIVRFVAIFAAYRDEKNPAVCDAFLELFLQFLLTASLALNKTARFRACQLISEIIMRLPDDAEVSSDVWDEVIESMKVRVGDKVPGIRTSAVRALARFTNDAENSDIVDLFLEALSFEQNAEVRKTIVLSLPPSNATSTTIIGCTLDVSEAVRRAAYCVLANKFPLQSLSIKLRTVILQRGLADRSTSVTKRCLNLMKDDWLVKCCNGDPVAFLKFLDVETYESVGESVMVSLLKGDMVDLQGDQRIQLFVVSTFNTSEGSPSWKLMEAELALYWRTVCRHLQTEAQAKGSDAAVTTGTEAAVYAAEASDKNDLLERFLPATVSDYVGLVQTHLIAGPTYRFTSRQLLLLGVMLDFSDASNRKVASAFVHELLHRPLEDEVDEDGNKVIIGDGINLGGDRDWATAVSELAKKVHASAGEFEAVTLRVVEELARSCRERVADFMHWMHCLAVTGLLLENLTSFRCLQGGPVGPSELLHSLLLPGTKHVHLDVQRVATRCLGLFGLLQRKPSEELVKQLRLSFVNGPSPVSVMASKALVDLGMWHGPLEVDRAMGYDSLKQSESNKISFSPVDFCDADCNLSVELLDLLYAGLGRDDWGECLETDDHESVRAILCEGFAKTLLLSDKYPSISASLHPVLLAKLVKLYFSNETEDLQRLKQCLSVFFEHYPALSANHKASIFGNATGSSVIVSNLRKRAIQASRFMLQMMQAPLYSKETEMKGVDGNEKSPDASDKTSIDFDCGEEGLAIRIAVEVANFFKKKTAAEKAYVSGLCKIAVLLHFRPTEQGAIKCMRGLLNQMAECMSADKELLKELKCMGEHLKALDEHPDQQLLQDQADLIFGRLDLDRTVDMDILPAELPTQVTKPSRSRRRVRREEVSSSSDEEETLPTFAVPATPSQTITRSQRASKTAAMSKMTAKKVVILEGNCVDDDDDRISDVTSEDESDAFEQ
ncbi:hypothetical protein GIB67_020897 [Kingdonia uniflora]|uniref:Nuclear condensin complex subunit 3 C-terminal domain-containing protein n=1 Tax=Kingdonia uniflora TaxID=39325 RepID=A0A7J7M7R6_9MAGN|nr:hypothetical protein GIB67_020897 [Kingdonia uniflora]